MPGQARLERRVAILVGNDLPAVHIDGCVRHCRIEDECDLAAGELWPPAQHLLIGEGALIGCLVEIVERQVHRVVWQADGLAGLQLARFGRRKPFGKDPGVVEEKTRTHHHSYLTEPSMPWTNCRCMKKNTARVGSVASTVPTMTTP